jgi:glutamate/tyrosine decarboxylase-like PLP-dependent enzyme
MSTLFPSRDERQRVDDALTRALAAADARVATGSVVPTFDQARFKSQLRGFDFDRPQTLESVLAWTIAQMETGIVHITHPRYFGLFNPAPTFPAQCADRIAAVFNPQLATARTSPAAVAIESHVIAAIAKRAGLPEGAGGHFATGGSEANYTALLCALMRADAGYASAGARAFAGAPVFYVSRDCHLAWIKLALMAGIGRSAVRLVATDGRGRMDCAALEKAIAADRASGKSPVMIVATAGTTNAGMIDPLAPAAALARREGLWLHVDAAWAGALIASPRLRGALAGIEEADSVTIDAHKWFGTTMGCGMFLASQPALLAAVFQVSTSFMPSQDSASDPYLASVQWSRRFMGLRLFLALAAAGWEGYAAHVERAVGLADLIKRRLEAKAWRCLNDSPAAVLCMVPPADKGSPKDVASRLVASGRAWVASARFEEQDVVRICPTHGETTAEDVDALVAALG